VGRLLEVIGDDHPRQMTISPVLGNAKGRGKRNSAYGLTSGGPPDSLPEGCWLSHRDPN
jgi:hypothetical protein